MTEAVDLLERILAAYEDRTIEIPDVDRAVEESIRDFLNQRGGSDPMTRFTVFWEERTRENLRRPGMRTAMSMEIDGALADLRRRMEEHADEAMNRAWADTPEGC
jgi:hypothetical protein